jgi:hypothetical protein
VMIKILVTKNLLIATKIHCHLSSLIISATKKYIGRDKVTGLVTDLLGYP